VGTTWHKPDNASARAWADPAQAQLGLGRSAAAAVYGWGVAVAVHRAAGTVRRTVSRLAV